MSMHLPVVSDAYSVEDQNRFWKKVNVQGPDECWEWTASKRHGGYGQFMYNYYPVKAHRFAWILANGEIQKVDDSYHGVCVCHRCDNPSCCNPKHLFLATQSENMADKIAKGRAKLGQTGMRGSTNPKALLTEKQVVMIRQQPPGNARFLAELYGVSKSTIYAVRSGQNWSHFQPSSDAASRNQDQLIP